MIEQLMPRTDPEVLDGEFVIQLSGSGEVVIIYAGSPSQCLLSLSHIHVSKGLMDVHQMACASHRKKTVDLGPLLRQLAESRTRYKYELSSAETMSRVAQDIPSCHVRLFLCIV